MTQRILLRTLILASLLVTLPSPSSASVLQAGGIIDAFSPGARGAGLAEAFSAVATGPFATDWNPGALGLAQRASVGVTHNPLAEGLADDVSARHYGVTVPLGPLGGGLTIGFLDQGTQTVTDISGNELGPVEPTQINVQLGGGVDLVRLLEIDLPIPAEFAVGANAKILRDDLGGEGVLPESATDTGWGFTADIGAVARAGLEHGSGARASYVGLRVGGVYDDVLHQEISFDDADQSDPFQRSLKGAVALEAQFGNLDPVGPWAEILVALEALKPRVGDQKTITSMGAEVVLARSVAIRYGRIKSPDGQIDSPTMGVGIGLEWTGLPAGAWLDYATFPQSSGLDRVHLVTLSANVDLTELLGL